MKKILFLIVTVISFVSCSEKEIDFANLVERNGKVYEVNSEKPYSGKMNKKNEKGQFIITGHYSKGLKDKEWVEYYKNGQKSSISNFSDNKLNGIQEIYSNKGQLVSSLKFSDNLRDGDFEYFYNDGSKKSKGNYSNDNYNGIIEKWYNNGKQKLKGNFENGEYNGLIEEWFNNGNPKLVANFKNGNYNGKTKEYNSLGYLQKEFNYKNEVYEGKYTQWHSENIKSKELYYEKGSVKSEKYWNSDGTKRPITSKGIIGSWQKKSRDINEPIFTFLRNGNCTVYYKRENRTYTGNYSTTKSNVFFNIQGMDWWRKVMEDVWEITYFSNKKIKYNIIKRRDRTSHVKGELIRIK